jgi:hypothetical protein
MLAMWQPSKIATLIKEVLYSSKIAKIATHAAVAIFTCRSYPSGWPWSMPRPFRVLVFVRVRIITDRTIKP